MPTFWDRSTRDEMCRRIDRLTPEARARWGKFTPAQMVAHLNDAMRMATGELPVAPRKLPIRYFPLKQLILYVLPFPKSAPTAPELLARCEAADLRTEQAEFVRIAERTATKSASDRWPDHPAFGSMSHKAWGKLVFRHTDHHLKQFGV
jgi:Protein of unknown function (DUF1569)